MTDMITLPDDVSLYPYQIDSLNRQLIDFLTLNKASNDYEIKRCPKCGSTTATFTKAGFTNFGKNGNPNSCTNVLSVANASLKITVSLPGIPSRILPNGQL